MAKKINTDELEALLSDVRKEIVGLLKTEESTLSKAFPGEESTSETEPDTSATKPADDGGPDGGPPDGGGDEASASPEGSPDDGGGMPPPDGGGDPGAGGDPGGDPGMDQNMDPQALQAEYVQLPLEVLKAHYLACKGALFAAMGAGDDPSGGGPPDASGGMPPDAGGGMPPDAAGGMPPDAGAGPGGPPPGAPPGGPPPGPPVGSAPPPDAPPALKAEIKPDYRTTAKLSNAGSSGGASAMKSEIAALKDKLTKTEAALEKMVGFVERVATTPVRKAVTSVADLANASKKPVSGLTKAEVRERLKRAIEKPTLAKSDRELITRYDLGHITVDKVAHLIEQ